MKLFTTASFNNKVKDLMDQVVKNNYDMIGTFDIEKLESKKEDGEILVPAQLRHNYITVFEDNKFAMLLCIVHALRLKKLIIFVATADQANFLSDLMKEIRHLPPRIKEFDDQNDPESFNAMNRIIEAPVSKLHGHMTHEERKTAFEDFRTQKTGVLISTDVGSRGLDFDNVALIVLLDPPETLAHYSNKVGRTARLASVGACLTLLHPPEKCILEKLQDNFDMNQLNVRPFLSAFEPAIPEYYPIIDTMMYLRHSIKKRASMSNDVYYLARRAFTSFCRAYSRVNDEGFQTLKDLHLHNLAKSYGLKGSKNDRKKEYNNRLNDGNNLDQQNLGSMRLQLRAKRDNHVIKGEFSA